MPFFAFETEIVKPDLICYNKYINIEKDKTVAGKKLNVTRKEFQESYKRHFQLYKRTQGNDKTRRLILFYSVECGLKSLLMKNTGNNTYEELEEYCKKSQKKELAGHNIKAMLKELNPNSEYTLKNIKLKRGDRIVRPEAFNQLWRYGVAVADEEDEKRAEEILEKIAEWIHERL